MGDQRVKARRRTPLKYKLNTRAWTKLKARHRSYCAARRLECARCRQPIDYSLPYRNPDGTVNLRSYECGHIISRRDRLDLMYVWSNLQPEHVTCNRGAQAKGVVPQEDWVQPSF